MTYWLKNEICFDSFEDAAKVAGILLKNSYCVMLSEEEFGNVVLNYEWTERFADRNQVVFMNRNTFDENFTMIVEDKED